MERNDNDIDDIRNDISIIKNNINTLSLAFNKHIQEHLITSSVIHNDVNITVLDNVNVTTDVSIINNTTISAESNGISNSGKQAEVETLRHNLIDYSFIANNDDNKLLIEIVSNNDKNMYSCYESNFLKFCDCAVSLVEEVIKIFLEKKFSNIEEDNDNLLQACDLVARQYQEKKFDFPAIYISKNQYKPYNHNVNHYYYNANNEGYLSLPKLKDQKIFFTLELCFVILYGEDFYKQPHNTYRGNFKSPSKALQRPVAKQSLSREPLNKEFYVLIDAARQFRNTIEHNQNNREERNKKLQELLAKKSYLKKTENNYDGIVEAVTWFIRQMYVDMTK